MADALVGSYVVDTKENYDAFMTGIGVPAEYIEQARNVKAQTKIEKVGDGAFQVTRIRPHGTIVNKLVIGQECEVDTIKGDKAKVTVNLVGSKLVAKGENYDVSTEIDGGRLKEVITLKGHTMTRYSKRE